MVFDIPDIKESLAFVMPFGKHKDKMLSEIKLTGIAWFARNLDGSERATKDCLDTKRHCKAILRYRRAEKRGENENKRTTREYTDTAKYVTVECNSCQGRSHIPRRVIDKRSRVACFKCGGTMVSASSLPQASATEDLYPITRMVKPLKKSYSIIKRIIDENKIPVFKHGKTNLYSMLAVERYLQIEKEGKTSALCESSYTKSTKSKCSKKFRNPAAKKMHEAECEFCQLRIIEEVKQQEKL
jgi:hypothetical protein